MFIETYSGIVYNSIYVAIDNSFQKLNKVYGRG